VCFGGEINLGYNKKSKHRERDYKCYKKTKENWEGMKKKGRKNKLSLVSDCHSRRKGGENCREVIMSKER